MTRFQTWWAEVRSNLWFVPTLLTLFSIGLAGVTLWLDRDTPLDLEATNLWWLFGGGAEGARGVLSAIAGGIITVTGVVFSITIVALQLASSQFTPRVLKNFTADPANQIVLGIFIGTFTYTLVIARAVRSPTQETAAFVPAISITVSMLLALVSIGFLIFFIHHIARSIQASVLIDRVAKDTIWRIENIFPARLGEPEDPERGVNLSELEEVATVPIRASAGGYLQWVDEDALFNVAERDELVVFMEPRVGDFILPGSVLALAGPADALTSSSADEILGAFVLGLERTPYQDVEFGIIELMDIAVKSSSSAINDPTTTITCLDRLGEILTRLGQRDEPARVRTGKTGKLHFIARRTNFDRAVHLAFDQIRHYGADNPVIAAKLISTLGKVAALVPEDRRAPLLEEAALVLHAARGSIENQVDLDRVEREAEGVLGKNGEIL